MPLGAFVAYPAVHGASRATASANGTRRSPRPGAEREERLHVRAVRLRRIVRGLAEVPAAPRPAGGEGAGDGGRLLPGVLLVADQDPLVRQPADGDQVLQVDLGRRVEQPLLRL